MYDLVSLGEVMLRMAPPRYERLRQARRLDVEVAGAQLNVAANMARFGKRSAFLSRLPDNELGTLAYDTCAAYDVDMRYVKRVAEGRMGINFLEFTATPRVGVTIFDRRDSAASTISETDFDWKAIAAQTRIMHTDGIMPGLSSSCREATLAYLRAAREAGCITSFDVNFRDHLWTAESARACWELILPLVDIVVTSRSVSESVFGFGGTDVDIMQQYQTRFGHRLVCLTNREMLGVLQGAWSSQALYNGQVVQGRRYTFDVVDRFGTGDAFFAGLLFGYLEGDVQFALDFGNAACALAHTTEGDIAQFTAEEIRPLLNETIDLRVKR